MGRSAVLLALLGACRIGFDMNDPADITALLPCTGPTRFPIGLPLAGLAATPTPTGFAVITAATTGDVQGWSYELQHDTLVATHEDVAIGGGANGTLGVAPAGTWVVVAVSNGSPAVGTTLYGLDAGFAPVAMPSAHTELAGARPLASTSHQIAFARQLATTDLQIGLVDDSGTDVGPPTTIAPAAKAPSSVQVIAAATGFAITYGTASVSPATGEVTLLDAATNVVQGPVRIPSDPSHDAYQPSIAYASAANVYLLTWFQKDVTDDDDIWGVVLDANLALVGQPFEIAAFSSHPAVASDGTGFWVTFRTYDPAAIVPDHLAAAHVAVDGTVTPRAVTSSGGGPGQWLMVERAGQAVLVWTETGGTGPDLYFDPMCP